MKKFKKILCLLLTGVLLLTSMGTGIPAFAADDDSNGGENSSSELLEIEVKTDKSNYTTLGIATFHVTITNISDQTIENISAEALFDDLAPVKGSSETKKEATSLSPNESFSFSYSATINANKVNLNIFQKIFLWIVRLFNGGFTAKANNFDNGREYVENTKSVKFGNFTADNTVRVWYGNEGIVESDLLTIDQSDFSTTEVKQVLSGKINLKEDIKRLYYTIEYQTSIDEKVEYDIINYENGTWQAENLLFPENNKITIFAETESCIYSSKPINIYYDRGESYALDTNHISYDEDYDGYYVNNLIIIDFEQGVSEERKNEIVQAIQGQVVGKINTIDELHVEVSPRNLVELENLCDILMKYDEVSFADWNEVHQTRSLSTPNDLWGYDKINPPIWNEENPAGNEWWFEAIQALSARTYNDYLGNVNIGIIDSGFDTTHEDIDILFPNDKAKKRNKTENHGTHVSGIIGAKGNNETGITGIISHEKLNLYAWCTDYFVLSLTDDIEIYDGLTALVEVGVKVVNMSLGKDDLKYSDDTHLLDNKTDKWGKKASEKIAKLRERNYDFIVVQSAGNGAKDRSTGNDTGVDAINNGFFCSVTEENCYSNKNVSKDEVLNRIIIVTACNKDNTLIDYSNGGSQVSIVAPGKSIYSTLAGVEEKDDDGNIIIANGQKYGLMSGTSMAAPMVSGVAGLVWSVNPNFTGEDVKEILCYNYYEGDYSLIQDNINSSNTFQMVKAKDSVEESIRRTYETGSISGIIEDADTEEPLQNVVVTAYNKDGTKSFTTRTNLKGEYDFVLPIGKYDFTFNLKTDNYNYIESTVKNQNIIYNYNIDLDIFMTKVSMSQTGVIKGVIVLDNDIEILLENIVITVFNEDKTTLVTKNINSSGEFEFAFPLGKCYLDIKLGINSSEYFPNSIEAYVSQNETTDLGNIFIQLIGHGQTGDDGTTNWDFIEPVTHKKTVPVGYTGIYTAQDLDNIRNNLSGKYILMNDIDLSNWGNWNPIGDNFNNFTGVFDGNGYAIYNLEIRNVLIDSVGLFGYCAEESSVSNVSLNNLIINIDEIEIDFTQASIGGIAGISSSTIKNCIISGDIYIINGKNVSVGGIAGTGGAIACSNSANIYVLTNQDLPYPYYGEVYCGGILGQSISTHGKVFECKNSGNIRVISGTFAYVGGITGKNGAVEFCINSGSVYGETTSYMAYRPSEPNCNVGGISGASNGLASYCVNYGDINGAYSKESSNSVSVGGIIGWCGRYNSGLTNCYNMGENINGVNAGRISYEGAGLSGNYSINTTLVNGEFPYDEIGQDANNGATLTLDEIKQKIELIPYPSL